MTKLGEAIRRSQRIESAPMGFGAAKQQPRPTILVAAVASGPEGLKVVADVAVLDGRKEKLSPEAVEKVASDSSNVIVGGFASGIDPEAVGSLREAGLDFLIFDPAETLAAALLDEDLGYIASLTASADEAYLRSLDALNLESVLVSDISLPLSVDDQLKLARVSQLTRKPLTCPLASSASAGDLRSLRAAGVRLLLASDGNKGALQLKEAVAGLPPPKGERQDRDRPMVSLPTGRQETDDEEEDD